MKLRDRFASWLGLSAADVRNPTEARWWGDQAAMSMSGAVVTPDRVLQLGAVQAVLASLQGSMEQLPVMVFRRGKGDVRAPERGHPLAKLLAVRPNARQSAAEFWGEITRHLAFYRNAYCRIRAGEEYAIGALEPIHPRNIASIEQRKDGRIYYTVARQGAANEVLRDDEIWHVRRGPLTLEGLQGVAVYESAREVFGRALAVNDYGSLWFRNSGQTGGIIKHPGTFKSKEDRQDFLDTWREGGSGANRHRDRLLTHGVDYTQLKVTNAEAQLLESEKSADVDMFGLWNFPPHRGARLDRATFSNIEQQSIDYVVHTLAPYPVAFEQAAERDLLLGADADELFVEFNVAGLLRGDIISRYRAYAVGRQWGWLSVNDVRRLENMNPVEGGEIYLQPLNMVPAGTEPDDETDTDEPGAEPPA